MTKKKLKEILKRHKLWLNGDECGERADFFAEDLSGMYIAAVDLRLAVFDHANLHGACLSGANLSEASFLGTDLSKANLYGADLHDADLYDADLYKADLYRANLYGADLRGSNLSKADLREANLNYSSIDYPMNCPEKGSFVAFKKANGFIMELLIPEDAKRSSGTHRQCRCSKAKVLSITNLDGSKTNVAKVSSNYDKKFIYRVGETIEVENFDDNRWDECAPGIHFFMTRREAVKY